MGRASVTDESGNGRYSIQLDYGTTELTNRLDRIERDIAKHEQDLAGLQIQVSEQEARLAPILSDLDTAINALDDTKETRAAVDKAATQYLDESTALQELQPRVAFVRLTIASLKSRKADLEKLVLVSAADAWCMDYTLGASGEVATVEINGEPPQILIAPGAPAPAESDGELRDRLLVGPATAYYNAATLPGWQRHMPTYRAGVLTAIDRENNTGTVNIGDAVSSAQSLPINQQSVLTGVPFEYMTCNHAAFMVGDDVVVGFEGSWETPKIIGFQHDPRACGPDLVWIPFTRGNESLGLDPYPIDTFMWNESRWSPSQGTTDQSRVLYSEPWVWNGSDFVMGYASSLNSNNPDYTATVLEIDGQEFGGTYNDSPVLNGGNGQILLPYNLISTDSGTLPPASVYDYNERVTYFDYIVPGTINANDIRQEVARIYVTSPGGNPRRDLISQDFYGDFDGFLRGAALSLYEQYYGTFGREVLIDFGNDGRATYEPLKIASGFFRRNSFRLTSTSSPAWQYSEPSIFTNPWLSYLDGHQPALFPGMIYRRIGSDASVFDA